jgi:penicillin-binding protein 1C
MVGAPVLIFVLLNFIFPLRVRVDYSAIITNEKGEILHAFLTPDEKWRMKSELNEISPLLMKTIIAKEDRYFYYHPGFNPFAMARAFARNISRGKRTSGASTITMQVARALEPKCRTYFNKVIEVFRAIQLECRYSKKEILQLYLNVVPYGGNIEGVKAAAFLYFKKNPDHLSLAEITALSIIPNRPSSLVIGKNNDQIVKERNRWLKKFSAEHDFPEQQIKDALEEPLTATRGTVPQYVPHLANRLRQSGSLSVRTSIDLNIQQTAEKIVADYSRSLAMHGIRNASAIVIDNKTHKVIAYIGSSDFYDLNNAGQVDGVNAIREPGSTLKPLLYGLCIDEGLMTPKSIITDVSVNYQGYAPENFDRKFNGYVSMEYALEHSLNIPAVKSLRLFGKDPFIQKLATCNFNQVKKDQQKLGLSMILGGCGATLEELTGLYSAFASKGIYYQPSLVAKDNPSNGVRIMSEAAAFMITETMSKVNRPDFPLNWQSTARMPKIAWKTGTSYGRRDAWSIGYNQHYTIGVWLGNFTGVGVAELSGANTATPLLFRLFNMIDYDSDEEWFTQPDDCNIRMVCSETGMPPADHCHNLVADYFIPLVSSMKPCDNMQEVMVSADGKYSYCRACMPEAGYKKKLYKVIPPEMQSYLLEHHIAYDQPPPHNPSCEKIFGEAGPAITSPRSGAEYLISRKNPEPLQLSCNTGNDVSKVYWYINDQFFKTVENHGTSYFMPTEGPLKISCTDDKGRNKNIWIRVKFVDL